MKSKIYLMFIFLSFSVMINGQTNQSLIKENAPKIFIDCSFCDMNYIKEQISIVNYVRDRKDADIHILSTSQSTASRGKEFILYFIGQNKFQNLNDTIRYVTNQSDSEDQIRFKMVKALKLGLVRYLVKTEVTDLINISFKEISKSTEKQEDDWDFWFFTTSTNTNFSGQKNYKNLYLNSSVSANRITEDLKLSFRLSTNYNESKFTYDDGTTKQNILSAIRSHYFESYLVKAIDSQWSWGIWLGANSSTYSNIEFSLYAAPGIEFNIFPYSLSNEKQLRIDYRLRHSFSNYSEETIYFKKKENLWSHSLEANLTFIKPWGNINLSTEGGNYLHDFNMYELSVNGSVSLKLVKGLSLNFFGGYSKINNQISLRRAGASLEEVLTQRRQLETSYNYWGGFGISYSFGSIYNNIVNPRFGNSGGGGMTIIIEN